MTPYEKLRSLPGAEGFLKPGATFEKLDAAAHAVTTLEAGGPAGPQGALPPHRQGAEPRSMTGPRQPPPPPHHPHLHHPSPSHPPRPLPPAPS